MNKFEKYNDEFEKLGNKAGNFNVIAEKAYLQSSKSKIARRPNIKLRFVLNAVASIVIVAILINIVFFKGVFNRNVIPIGPMPSNSSLTLATTDNNDNKETPIINPFLNNIGKIVVDSDTILNTIIKSKDGGFVTIGNKSKGSNSSAVIYKFDNYGNKEWTKSLDDTGIIQSIIQTDDGGYITILTSPNTQLIYKLDNKGNKEWSKTLDDGGDIRITRLNKVIQTTDKNFIVVGQGNNNTTSGAIIIKFNNSGSIIWKVLDEASGTFSADFKSVIQADDGGLVAIGYSGLIDSALTDKNTVYGLSVIVKFDSNGNKLWSQHSSSNYGLGSITQTSSGEFLVSGYLCDEVFKNSLYGTLTKYSNDGNKLWVKSYKESLGGSELLTNFFKTNENSIIGVSGPYICEIDNNGNVLWKSEYNEYANDYIYVTSIIRFSEDGYVACGKGYADGRACIFFFDGNGNLKK